MYISKTTSKSDRSEGVWQVLSRRSDNQAGVSEIMRFISGSDGICLAQESSRYYSDVIQTV